MLEQLLPYYEKELGFLRELAGEFAGRHPKIAQRLSLQGDRCEDPHVERLIEAFAFLTARIHRRLDDEFPEIAEGFLQTLYPHYLRPIPSTTIVSLDIDGQPTPLNGRYLVPRHQKIVTPSINGEPCIFRTSYDVALHPLQLAAASLELAQPSVNLRRLMPDAYAVLTLDFKSIGATPVSGMDIDKLRLFIDAEPQISHFIYEILLTQCIRIDVSAAEDGAVVLEKLGPDKLRSVGFSADEALLDYDSRSFPGYIQLIEYFACPEKYLFVDIDSIGAAASRCKGDTLRLRIWLSRAPDIDQFQRYQARIGTQNFRLHCTPAINLFKKGVDPIRLGHLVNDYPVVPDGRRPLAYEVITIDSVLKVDRNGGSENTCEIPPVYATGHRTNFDGQNLFWCAKRESSAREYDDGTDVWLSLVDQDWSDGRPDSETLSLICTCSNRDGPEHLPFGGDAPLYQLPGHSVVTRVRPLRKPSRVLRPPTRRGLQWRLISHLSLNLQSLVGSGADTLRELLSLYDFSAAAANFRQLNAILELRSSSATARVGGATFSAFVRGTEIELMLNEDEFVGTGAYLFCCLMERFFALYCAPNSFTRLRVHSRQRGNDLFCWSARSGDAVLL